MSDEILLQHALKLFAECEYEQQTLSAALISVKLTLTPEQTTALLQELRAGGLLDADALSLTISGREYALHVLKAHRLYETYLANKTGHPETRWHQLADEQEHALSRDDVAKLAEELGHPRFDPHGDPIPSMTGDMPSKRGKALSEYPVGWVGRVVHIEDEPAHLYARISQAGITTNSVLRMTDKTEEAITLRLEGLDFRFALEVAAQITAVNLEAGETFDDSLERLSSLRAGEQAEIVGMSALCRGLERNRLLDLGVVPGTLTSIEIINPSGSPIGYRLRGACIALRREQADHIRIRKVQCPEVNS